MIKYKLVAILFLVSVFNTLYAQRKPQVHIDWAAFMSSNDIIFNKMTNKWGDGVFTGNGLLGNMIYLGNSDSIVRMDIGRTDLRDHRGDTGSNLFLKARLPIGYFTFNTVGKLKNNRSKIAMWNAETQGSLTTDKGGIDWRSLTFSQANVILFEANTKGAEKDFTWHWHALKSESPRIKFKPETIYQPNPAPVLDSVIDGVHFCLQPMLAGGAYVTAWKEQIWGNTRRYFISVGYSQSSQVTAVKEALKNIQSVAGQDLTKQIAVHRAWWHRYYQKSFLSVPDKRMEKFYWAQMYKLGSALHPGSPALDLMGPWPAPTPWPNYWNNLNIQLAYSPLYKANHLALAATLTNKLDENKQNLINNVPKQYRYNAAGIARSSSSDMISSLIVTKADTAAPASATNNSAQEVGNLTWIMYHYWQQYQFSMDKKVLKGLLPLLERSINYYLDIMHKGADGYYHLPYTYSPEYALTRDCNYDLSLLRWGLQTLIDLDANAKRINKWKEVLSHLVPYPADDDVLRIGRDRTLTSSHRHYSHLLMIYPLQIMNWEQPQNRAMIKASIAEWQSRKGALQGYSYTGSASMYAMMGLGNKADAQLQKFFNSFVKNNTFYTETGPVIETPLAAATSIQELLLQTRNDTIYVFHAVPDKWKKASFENMLTEGAFEVTAVLSQGRTQWVRIKSKASGVCNVNVGKAAGRLKVMGDVKQKNIKYVSDSSISFFLKKGKEVWLYVNEPDLNIPLVPANAYAAMPIDTK